MKAMELNKENIEYEHLLSEKSADTVVKAEYVIPDTHPDVSKILQADGRTVSVTCEVMQDKVYFEGEINYVVLYNAKEDGKDVIHSVSYSGKFSNYIDIMGTEHKMSCYPECTVEHIGCTIVNERKIAIEGIISTKAKVYKSLNYEIVKDITSDEEIQLLKTPISIDKNVASLNMQLNGKTQFHISMDKPQISSILKSNVRLHKCQANVIEGKVQAEAAAFIEIVYSSPETRDIQYISGDIPLKNEEEVEGALSSMNVFSDFNFEDAEISIREDDIGESRIIDVSVTGKADIKVSCSETMDMIEDAYSPLSTIELVRKEHELNNLLAFSSAQAIIKDNIEVNADVRPSEIIMCKGEISITDKKILEDRINIEGIINTSVLYKTLGEDFSIEAVEQEVPFTSVIEISGTKPNMQCICRAYIESLDAVVEAGTIGIKGVIIVSGRAYYTTQKNFIEDITVSDKEPLKKKASITIYVIQTEDTLWNIAKKYCTTVESLVRLNNIDDENVINAGQKILIPGRAVL